MKKIIYAITTAILISTFTACGGSSGGGGVGPSYTADFSDGTAGAEPCVTLQKSSVSGSTVYVNIVVTGVSNLYGADIKLTYDAAKVKWGGSHEEGTVLEANGTVTYLVGLDSGAEGTLVIGVSLQGNATPVASATGVLVTIPFTVIATGTSPIDFTVTDLYDNIPVAMTVSSTAGGTISGI